MHLITRPPLSSTRRPPTVPPNIAQDMAFSKQPAKGDSGLIEKLPAELKVLVYSLALPQNVHYRLGVYGGKQKFLSTDGKMHARKAVDEVAPLGHHRNKTHRGMKWDIKNKEWGLADNSTVALLYKNKTIRRETAPLLYLNNRFEFETTDVLCRFLKQIDPKMHQHLRTITISAYGWSSKNGRQAARDAITTLASAKGLRTLEVSHFEFCTLHFHKSRFWGESTDSATLERAKLDTVDNLIFFIKPLIVELCKAYKAKNLDLDALKVVKVMNMPFLPGHPHPISFQQNPRDMGTQRTSDLMTTTHYQHSSLVSPETRCLNRLATGARGQVNEMLTALMEQKLEAELEKMEAEGEKEDGESSPT